MNAQTLFVFCISALAALIVLGVSQAVLSRRGQKVRQRLSADQPGSGQQSIHQPKPSTLDLFKRIGQAAAKPFLPSSREKQSGLRRKLEMAGLYSASTLRLMTGCKVILLTSGVLGGYLIGAAFDQPMMGLSVGGLIGYLLPVMWLKHRTSVHQKNLEYGLPDALDLMVVCVEAGLATDSAMQRVGEELMTVHPDLAREMEICHMETRVGLARSESLRNMGQRTANASLASLASMMIQAERFGTSIGNALRIHAESLRIARHHKAEELAAKASVKMTFPLVLFIFPATFIVLAGPTVVQLLNSPLFK